MISFRKLSSIAAVAAFLTSTGAADPLAAQLTQPRSNGGPRVAAWVAMAPAAATWGGAPFVVVRGVGPGREDVLLLPPEADAALLSDAVRALLTSRSVDGDTTAHPGTFRVRPRAGERASRAPLPWAARVVRDVQAAPFRELPGVGRVRAVRIWLPAVAARKYLGLVS